MSNDEKKYDKIINKFSIKQLQFYKKLYIIMGIIFSITIIGLIISLFFFYGAFVYNKCIIIKKEKIENRNKKANKIINKKETIKPKIENYIQKDNNTKNNNVLNQDIVQELKKDIEINNVIKKEETKKDDIKNFTFKVTGVTFKTDDNKDRQKIIKKLIKQCIDIGGDPPYEGWSNKEIKEYGVSECFYAGSCVIANIRLEKTKYNNKDAVKVFIGDYDDIYYDIGWVGKENISEVINIIENKELWSMFAQFTGGKYKKLEYDDEYNEVIEIYDDLTYGVNITIRYKDKKDET